MKGQACQARPGGWFLGPGVGPVAALILAVGLAVGSAVPVPAQEAPHPRAALLQCLMTAAEPGRRVDGICSDLAMDVCAVGRGPAAAAECRAEIACRFVEEGLVLRARLAGDGAGPGGPQADWRAVSEGCAGRDLAAAECRQAAARDWWITAREGARAASEPLAVADAEVARCWLD